MIKLTDFPEKVTSIDLILFTDIITNLQYTLRTNATNNGNTEIKQTETPNEATATKFQRRMRKYTHVKRTIRTMADAGTPTFESAQS